MGSDTRSEEAGMSGGGTGDTGAVTGAALRATPDRTTHPYPRLVGAGVAATVAAMAATTLTAALARTVGVDFEVSGGETIPVSGVAVMTGFFSLVGVVIAVVLLRWSARPADRFVWTAVSLTALSVVPPFLSGADVPTVATLLGLHLAAAAVMIPVLVRSLHARAGARSEAERRRGPVRVADHG